jgi:arginase family enzyme
MTALSALGADTREEVSAADVVEVATVEDHDTDVTLAAGQIMSFSAQV